MSISFGNVEGVTVGALHKTTQPSPVGTVTFGDVKTVALNAALNNELGGNPTNRVGKSPSGISFP